MVNYPFAEGASLKPFEQAIQNEMDKAIKHFEKELVKIRSGKAHTSMVEDIKVNCYDSVMPLRQLAAISAPDTNLLVIQPWDKGIIAEIEKAISQSDLGVSPVNDGNVIRIQLPRLSTDRREELIRALSKKVEECKVAIRNVRKEFHNSIRDSEKNKKVSEDYSKRLQDILQKTTDRLCESVDKQAAKKEQDLRTV